MTYLSIDTSALSSTITSMKSKLNEAQFKTLMYRSFSETGRKVKTILRRELPKEYCGGANWIGSQVGSAKTSYTSQGMSGGGGAASVSCVIPISGARAVAGGRITATGGLSKKKVKGKRDTIKLKILQKGGMSVLPATMEHQGGNPPFRARGLVFTRTTEKAKPVARVVALGVPQMPMNRSQDDVQGEIVTYLQDRLVHNFNFMMSQIGGSSKP